MRGGDLQGVDDRTDLHAAASCTPRLRTGGVREGAVLMSGIGPAGMPSAPGVLCDTTVGCGVPLLENREKAHFMKGPGGTTGCS